jgi:type III pantothenate kinase
MLLTIDVGNTNTVLGLYADATASSDLHSNEAAPSAGSTSIPSSGTAQHAERELLAHWRVTTPNCQTSDEFGLVLHGLLEQRGMHTAQVTGIAISSVVPNVDAMLRRVCDNSFHVRALFVEPGIKTGLPVLTDNPAEVGADRIVNCVAAFERYGSACIIVDMGTATTFDVLSAKGEYLGGAIAPGLGISADALFTHAARLPRVEIRKPAKIVGTNTIEHIQIGLYYGYIGLVDGILDRLLDEVGRETRVVATGGLASLIAGGSRFIGTVDEMLTLHGLRLLYERNVERHGDRHADRQRRRP